MPHAPGHTLRYAFLYHREIVAVNFLPTLLFLYPVHMGGVVILPIVALGKSVISVLLIYLQFRNLDAKNVFFGNRNFRVRNLHLVYFTVDFIAYGAKRVLEPSTLRIENSGVTALLGRNGSGKSSIFNAIFDLIRVPELAITVDGVFTPRPYLVPGLLNYLPQKASHPDWFSTNRVLREYGLIQDKFYASYPTLAGFGNMRLDELSYGTRRLLLTLVLLEADVRYTILDEPFSHVMPLYHDAILATLKAVKQRKGILLTDHQFRTVLPASDRFYLIADRRVVPLRDTTELVAYGYGPPGST